MSESRKYRDGLEHNVKEISQLVLLVSLQSV